MIDRNFEGYKFRRTYIGNSKLKEKEIFLNVQGTKEDNSECDWFEYRRILIQYYDDILHVLLSWKELTVKIGVFIFALMLAIELILPDDFLIITIILFVLSTILLIIHFILKDKTSNTFKAYEFCLNIVLLEIEKKFNIKLEK